jgi:UDP-glucuronate 4-epimerase
MNILVTGGAGFIGSHLCERLIAVNNNVICLDNFNPFYNPEIKWQNLSEMILNHSFKLVEGDIRNPGDLDKCFAGQNVDLVVHLAAMAGVRPSIENPLLYTDVNITGTLQVLLACQKYRVKKLIFASPSSVYGNKEGGRFKESDDVDKPVSPYAATKRSGELICFNQSRLMDISILCLRFFTVYGPRQRPDLAIHKFTRLLYEGNPIPVYGDGSTSRDYTYIDDTIDGILKAINYVNAHPGFEIFNLGESQTIQLKDMIFELEKASGRKAALDTQPLQPGDVNYTCADIERSRKVLYYNPTWEFRKGISKFIGWFEKSRLV